VRTAALCLLVFAACATPDVASGEGTGERGRAVWTTGLDADDVTDLGEGVLATLVQLSYFTGCAITLQDDCAIRAENAGREFIGREPRTDDE
jgi:hypothetical protein